MRKSHSTGGRFACSVFVAAAAFSASVHAQQAASASQPVPGAAFGTQTDALLSMQMDPAYTANDPRPISGEVANRTFVRYLNSFSHPIPEQFDRQSFSGSGGGSSGSSSSNASSNNNTTP